MRKMLIHLCQPTPESVSVGSTSSHMLTAPWKAMETLKIVNLPSNEYFTLYKDKHVKNLLPLLCQTAHLCKPAALWGREGKTLLV